MLQLRIFTGYFPYTLAEVIRRIKGHGFTTVQLDLDFRDMDLSTGALDANAAARIRNAFRGADLPICCISGHTFLCVPLYSSNFSCFTFKTKPTRCIVLPFKCVILGV